MTDSERQRGSPFWRFSLGFYRQSGVADACIALQDGCGVDVNILLLFLWLATARRCLPPAGAKALCAQAGPWRDDVVVPLRTLRRRLKDGSSLVERSTAELFRTKIKAVELESERLQQEAMFALADGLATESAPTIEAAARANVAAYEHAVAQTFASAPVDVLIAALSAGQRGAG
jgi:uncharacterized protein (TIGR02444 family)